MQTETISIKCPSCGGSMVVNRSHSTITCPYCANKILIKSENEVELQKLANEYDLKSKELEIQKQQKKDEVEQQKHALKYSLFILAGVGVMIIIMLIISAVLAILHI